MEPRQIQTKIDRVRRNIVALVYDPGISNDDLEALERILTTAVRMEAGLANAEADLRAVRIHLDARRLVRNLDPDQTADKGDNMRTLSEGSPTPWGPVQTYDYLGSGVYVVDTAGHGGLYLPPELVANIPPVVRDTALTEPGWPNEGWAEEDCRLPVAMAFIYPHLDKDRVRYTFPAQERCPEGPLAFWNEAALRMAEGFDSLRPCLPYLTNTG